jgi:hypothetical protein
MSGSEGVNGTERDRGTADFSHQDRKVTEGKIAEFLNIR